MIAGLPWRDARRGLPRAAAGSNGVVVSSRSVVVLVCCRIPTGRHIGSRLNKARARMLGIGAGEESGVFAGPVTVSRWNAWRPCGDGLAATTRWDS